MKINEILERKEEGKNIRNILTKKENISVRGFTHDDDGNLILSPKTTQCIKDTIAQEIYNVLFEEEHECVILVNGNTTYYMIPTSLFSWYQRYVDGLVLPRAPKVLEFEKNTYFFVTKQS